MWQCFLSQKSQERCSFFRCFKNKSSLKKLISQNYVILSLLYRKDDIAPSCLIHHSHHSPYGSSSHQEWTASALTALLQSWLDRLHRFLGYELLLDASWGPRETGRHVLSLSNLSRNTWLPLYPHRVSALSRQRSRLLSVIMLYSYIVGWVLVELYSPEVDVHIRNDDLVQISLG